MSTYAPPRVPSITVTNPLSSPLPNMYFQILRCAGPNAFGTRKTYTWCVSIVTLSTRPPLCPKVKGWSHFLQIMIVLLFTSSPGNISKDIVVAVLHVTLPGVQSKALTGCAQLVWYTPPYYPHFGTAATSS